MVAVICPTITATSAEAYQAQMDKIAPFAGRVHIDIADGVLAPHKLLDPDKLWWPGNMLVDVHVMYQRPAQHLELFVVQHPNLVIVHAEADGDFVRLANKLHAHGIQVGVALLPETPVQTIATAIDLLDHLLIFSGNLGYQGGSHADLRLLMKARQAKSLKPSIEIGWDGGVNEGNVRQLTAGGIDVLNVGGYIQTSPNPARAYATLNLLTKA